MLITESDYKKLSQTTAGMKLYRNKVKFTLYESDAVLPILGKVKLVIKNVSGKKVETMAYVVKGGK